MSDPISIMGISPVDSSELPPPPRQLDRDTKFWKDAKFVIDGSPGSWFKVKTYERLDGARQKSTRINAGSSVMFPADQYEARHKNGVLFLRRRSS